MVHLLPGAMAIVPVWPALAGSGKLNTVPPFGPGVTSMDLAPAREVLPPQLTATVEEVEEPPHAAKDTGSVTTASQAKRMRFSINLRS